MTACRITQIAGPELIKLAEAALVMVIGEIQTPQLRPSFSPLTSGL